MTDHCARLLSVLPLPQGYQLIEQGCYRYLLNGKVQAIAEPWVKAHNSQGQLLIHSGRFVDELQSALLVSYQSSFVANNTFADKSARHKPTLPDSFDSEISWQQTGQATIKACYQYCQDEKQLNITLKNDAGLLTSNELRTEPFAYFPLLRVFSGQVIQSLAQSGPLPTLVPDIHDPGNRAALLRPTYSLRSAKPLAAEVIQLAGRHYSTQRYQYLSERYQPQDEAAFWIDPTGLLLKYCWQQNPDCFWQVELHSHQVAAFTDDVTTESQPPCDRT